MRKLELVWLAGILIVVLPATAFAEEKVAKGEATLKDKRTIRFDCLAGEPCAGAKLELKAGRGVRLTGSLDGAQISLRYDDAEMEIKAILEVLQPAELEDFGTVQPGIDAASLQLRCDPESPCEAGAEQAGGGKILSLKRVRPDDLGGFTEPSIEGSRARVRYRRLGLELLAVLDVVPGGKILDAEGVVEQVSPTLVRFRCSAPSPCRGRTLLLRLSDQVTDLGDFDLDAMAGRTVSLTYDAGNQTLLRLLGSLDSDIRGNFEASAYAGAAIDSFAAGDLRKYLNPEDSGDIRERGVAGFDFAYRVAGSPTRTRRHQQLWIYGETAHGMRSAEADCRESGDLPECEDFDPLDPNGAGRVLTIIRNATSLEGFVGLRYEFGTLQPGFTSPAVAYFKAQAGFIAIAGQGGDVVDINNVAIGALATRGRYRGSYLEAGYGTTDLFVERPNGRWRLDAFLTWSPRWLSAVDASPFAEIAVDADLKDGPDSIQTYIGLDFDLDRLLGGMVRPPKRSRRSP